MVSRHSRGDVVRLTLDLISSGVGVVSELPTIAIQRLADLKWFQASDSTWQTTKVENAMTETDSTNLPGRYHFDFDQSKDVEVGSTKHTVRKSNIGTPLVLEYEDLVFGPLAGAGALNLCSVQGTIFDAQSEPLENILVRATLIPVFKDSLGRAVQSDRVVATYTRDTGDFDLPLVRGGTFRLEISEVGFDRRVVIPDQDSVLFTDL